MAKHLTKDQSEAASTATLARLEKITEAKADERATLRGVVQAMSIHCLNMGQVEVSAELQDFLIGWPNP